MDAGRDAFDRFFDYYFPRVYLLAWRRHAAEADIQATTQQVLTALLLRAEVRGLAHAPDDPALHRLAIRLIKKLEPPPAWGYPDAKEETASTHAPVAAGRRALGRR